MTFAGAYFVRVHFLCEWSTFDNLFASHSEGVYFTNVDILFFIDLPLSRFSYLGLFLCRYRPCFSVHFVHNGEEEEVVKTAKVVCGKKR